MLWIEGEKEWWKVILVITKGLELDPGLLYKYI